MNRHSRISRCNSSIYGTEEVKISCSANYDQNTNTKYDKVAEKVPVCQMTYHENNDHLNKDLEGTANNQADNEPQNDSAAVSVKLNVPLSQSTQT
jgi:hypothetical protein